MPIPAFDVPATYPRKPVSLLRISLANDTAADGTRVDMRGVQRVEKAAKSPGLYNPPARHAVLGRTIRRNVGRPAIRGVLVLGCQDESNMRNLS